MNTRFIRRPVDLAAARQGYFEELANVRSDRRLVVWGAGRAGTLALQLLRDAGMTPELVVDRDPAKRGGRLGGIPIAGPDELRRYGTGNDDYVVLASMHAPAMALELAAAGWRPGRDYRALPVASIYQPDFGFVLADFERRRAGMVRNIGAESPAGDRTQSCPVATVLASSQGNFFFRELRDFLVGGLRRAGWIVEAADETAHAVSGVPIVVGPHEFFSVGAGIEWFSEENLRAAVLLWTEQPQSAWFREFAPVFAHAGVVVDISPNGAAAWRSLGIDAPWLPLGWYSGCGPFDHLSAIRPTSDGTCLTTGGPLPPKEEDRWLDRPIDVLFLGSESPRRRRVLEELQTVMPNLRWVVRMPSDGAPLSEESDQAVDTVGAVALARRSKVLLNIHRDDTPFWEWQRIVWRGLWQRTLVVTEDTGGAAPPLRAGRDYLEAEASALAGTLQAVFATDAGTARADEIRCSGWRTATHELSFAAAETILERACAQVGALL